MDWFRKVWLVKERHSKRHTCASALSQRELLQTSTSFEPRHTTRHETCTTTRACSALKSSCLNCPEYLHRNKDPERTTPRAPTAAAFPRLSSALTITIDLGRTALAAQRTRSDCQYTREDKFGRLKALGKAVDRPSRATLGRPNVQNFVSKKKIMAPSVSDQPPSATNGDTVPKIGPHPGFISSSNQYTTELRLRRMLKDNGCDPARQDSYRLQGVQLIENVRAYLQL